MTARDEQKKDSMTAGAAQDASGEMTRAEAAERIPLDAAQAAGEQAPADGGKDAALPAEKPAGAPQGAPGKPATLTPEQLAALQKFMAGQKGGAMPIGMPGQQPKNQPAQSLFEPSDYMGRSLHPDDLPYAAEVASALARKPGRMARWLSLSVVFFFAAFTAWAAVAELDEVTHAEGQVVASSRTQVIQNLEGGILREINVREGQTVEKGAVLARIDNELAESSLRDAMNRAMENHAALRRLRAVINGLPLSWAKDPVKDLLEACGHAPDDEQLARLRSIQRVQETIYNVQTRQRAAELDVLDDQVRQRRLEVQEQSSRLDHLRESYTLIRQQLDMAGPLVGKGSYSKVQYLDLQERVVRMAGEIAALESSLPRAEAAAGEALHRVELRRAEMDTALMEEVSKRSADLAALRESLSAGSDKVIRTELKAPVRGTVKTIYLNTLGGVVKPGEPIMELVPLDDTLLVEARVRPSDVAFLHPGLPAMVKISAYDFAIYGGLEGKLEQISADTIEDKRGEFFYLVKVRTEKTIIEHNGEILPIIPGMMSTVDIMTGKKTVLNYLLKPILKAKQNALREK
ncbi:MAG: HlyD family type I secretion periplasmic adaptor subunit [Desulfovibrionaceae bacterium]|nr:HlyD family type I secretion periplasmic adaptor subunit [Desulfovibrionaceae bacterium]